MYVTGHVAGRPSWRATVDMPSTLVLALHLRDAGGLQVRAERTAAVPPLEPFVERDGALAGHATQAAAAAWGAWWDGLLDRHPEFRGVPPLVTDTSPQLPDDLRALIEAGLPDAEAWFTARKREELDTFLAHGRPPKTPLAPVHEVVEQLEAESGRPAAPFDLLISILPVRGHWGRRVRRDHVLVSRQLMDYTDGVAALLDPVLRDLAA